MKFLPYLSSLLISSSVLLTHSCHALLGSEKSATIVGKDNVEKHVKLLSLAPERLRKMDASLFVKAEKNYATGITHFVTSGTSVDLGMANVPVLDQGQFGTCVTFSSTAALDARISGGDFISQQCSLALDQALGDNYWEGADYPSQIIDPLKAYGVVSKDKCPEQYGDDSELVNPSDYKLLADAAESAEVEQVTYIYSAKADLNAVKAALKSGHRVLMAFSLNGDDQLAVQGFNVKVDGVQDVGGLWACKQRSSANYCQNSNAGHEVLVIGYDDTQQLLKIRNSWNVQVGDDGDYYMTYTYFNTMAVDSTIIN